MTPTTEQIIERLQQARLRVKAGWTQHIAFRARMENGRLVEPQACLEGACAVGLLTSADHDDLDIETDDITNAAIRAMRETLYGAHRLTDPVTALWQWNDQPHRTQDEAVKLIELTIIRLGGVIIPDYVPEEWVREAEKEREEEPVPA